MLRPHPLEVARALADELDAELVEGGAAAEELVDRLAARSGRGPHLDLEALEAGVRRAEFTRERTRQAVAAKLSRTINTALAIHPDTLRTSAAELIAATDRHLDALQRSFPSARARLRTVACGVVALAGVALIGFGALVGGVAVVAVWTALAGVSWGFERRRVRLAATPLHDAQVLEGVARRRWEQLVGPGRSPHDVDAIVARYDPQHDLVGDLIANHPAVRAADHLASVRHADLDRAAQTLNARAAGAPAGEVASTTVVVEPYRGLTEQRCRALHRRLLALPPSLRVIVVLAPGPAGEDRPVIDLTDGAPAAGTGHAEAAETVGSVPDTTVGPTDGRVGTTF